MSDEDQFQALLGDDVKPIKIERRVVINKNAADEKTLAHRREKAESEEIKADDPLAGEPIEMVDPLAELSFRRPGVQHGVFRNLRQGKYAVDARLDLHKMNIERARREVYQFIKDCMQNDVRTALITHGKGETREQPALLKSCVAHWLPQMEEVLAFHSAQKQHGGVGATYILLRKSERQKQETRDKLLRADKKL
ncbi:DNA endonuclease SmrA [Saccharophagus sp. K07]|uniref:DNA endonuclease SmrA n=1 Tax=Saccharophagus sp. K07 TaxID=2283636 RepID=UPI001651FD7E|nr:DNA endonuclease SmrA [Saccharophagus sp. K07]MBC6904301.1 DNA endonuclease SmrA [Saccharophagus sp. K07]